MVLLFPSVRAMNNWKRSAIKRILLLLSSLTANYRPLHHTMFSQLGDGACVQLARVGQTSAVTRCVLSLQRASMCAVSDCGSNLCRNTLCSVTAAIGLVCTVQSARVSDVGSTTAGNEKFCRKNNLTHWHCLVFPISFYFLPFCLIA